MKICVLDPAAHIPSLKILFPDAEYFAHEPDSSFRYPTTPHYTSEENFAKYGFRYRTDWDAIQSSQFTTLFLVAPLLNYFDPAHIWELPGVAGMRDTISTILRNNTFQKVVLFDTYDYDYDPTTIGCTWPIDIFFKRNYSKKVSYKKNVVPFPFMMFLKPCLLGMSMNMRPTAESTRFNTGLWVGTLFNHVDHVYNVFRNREKLFHEIKDHITHFHQLSEYDYNQTLKMVKIGIDLMGVGDPSKRTFEILNSGALLMTTTRDLVWPFPNGDDFSEAVYFSNAEEFKEKYTALITNPSLYSTALSIQNRIIYTYFNKEWISSYILTKLNDS